jgi:hypothetical protein
MKKIRAFLTRLFPVKLFRPEPEPEKRKFVQVDNRLIEYVEPPSHIPEEKIAAMQRRARELKLKYPQMSLERIQRKVCEEFHVNIDKSQTVERVEIGNLGAVIKKMERK